jgi:hypothetical protein
MPILKDFNSKIGEYQSVTGYDTLPLGAQILTLLRHYDPLEHHKLLAQ